MPDFMNLACVRPWHFQDDEQSAIALDRKPDVPELCGFEFRKQYGRENTRSLKSYKGLIGAGAFLHAARDRADGRSA
jgi:hypothetical protein